MQRVRQLHSSQDIDAPKLLTGQVLVGIEPSGRVPLPAIWKYRFQPSGFALPRLGCEEDPYVMLFSSKGIESRMLELRSAHHRALLLRSVTEVKVDRQGRVVVPEVVNLLGGASCVAVIGAGDHLRFMSERSAADLTRYDEEVLSEIV